MDRVVFKKTKAAFGGRVRFVVSGGAPLGPSVEEFLHITLCCPVLQASKACFNNQGGTFFDAITVQCLCCAAWCAVRVRVWRVR